MERGKSSFEARHKKSRLQSWKDLIGEVEKDPWGLAFKMAPDKIEALQEILSVLD